MDYTQRGVLDTSPLKIIAIMLDVGCLLHSLGSEMCLFADSNVSAYMRSWPCGPFSLLNCDRKSVYYNLNLITYKSGSTSTNIYSQHLHLRSHEDTLPLFRW